MVFPLQSRSNSLELNADLVRPPRAPDCSSAHPIAACRADAAAVDDDLQRLQSSLQWVKSELTIAAREAGSYAQNHRRGLPRASQLPAVPGISPANAENSAAGQRRPALPLELAPPLASERLPVPARGNEHAYNLRGAVLFLIASVVAGSIAYHVSAGGFFAASEPAQAAAADTMMAVGVANHLH
jgi:hypothetical protein